ncbi:RagB/SusD family nutrient uptake outer membrane protein [Mucilaginibacter phyllosphaerae]
MKYFKKHLCVFVVIGIVCSLSSCKREETFLNAKPNQALSLPSTLADLQLLLKNESLFNRNYPSIGENSTDDMMLDASTWLSSTPIDKNVFTWAKGIYPAGAGGNDWNYPYQLIFNTNVILQQVDIVPANHQASAYKTVKGSALFFRSIALFNLLQIYALPYNKASASNDLGVPMPDVPNLNLKFPRLTQDACYKQIIGDLNAAASLLPDLPISKTEPSKAGAYALLSRIYLVMGDYSSALLNANAALGLFSTLQDLNKITSTARPVYPDFSPEEIFHAGMLNYTSNGSKSQVAPDLYALFNDPNDLRLKVYFRTAGGLNYFNSQYDRRSNLTYALSTAELYLNKAECEARLNNLGQALIALNMLLVNRWKTATFEPISGSEQSAVLALILRERRKELALTGIRWYDLRRLNQEPAFAVTLTRKIGADTYTLPPNDARYALPIPDNEIQYNQIPQNVR